MASDRTGRGFLATGCVALICIFIPVLGHIILTVMILNDDLSGSEKLLWLLVVWVFWFIGPFLYLLLGQRHDRLFGERAL
ncbi:MAG: PLD nuclease N-terminal domain-containing protein [Ktedonobacterales bacterium]